MPGIFILYLLTFVPIKGAHKDAQIAARDAALIQVGAKAEWDQVSRAAIKKAPREVVTLIAIGGSIQRKEIKWRYKEFSSSIKKDRATLTYTINF